MKEGIGPTTNKLRVVWGTTSCVYTASQGNQLQEQILVVWWGAGSKIEPTTILSWRGHYLLYLGSPDTRHAWVSGDGDAFLGQTL